MDPDSQKYNQNNMPPMQPAGQAQPTQPIQPVQPMQPIQPVQPMQPIQSAQPMQPVQSVQPVPPTQPTQVMQPYAQLGQTTKPKNNSRLIWIVVIVALVFGAAGTIVGLILGGVIKFGGVSTPTIELARSVCEKHGGTIYDSKDHLNNSEDYTDVLSCDGSELSNPFNYRIFFVTDDSVDKYKEQVVSIGNLTIMNDGFTILEDSDTYKKNYYSYSYNSVTHYYYMAMYKNAIISLVTMDDSYAEDLLVELGFPDRSRVGSSATTNKETSNDPIADAMNTYNIQAEKRDTQRRNDMMRVDTSLVQYQTNNHGTNNGSNLPLSGYWEGAMTFTEDCSSNAACSFVRNYMNTGIAGTATTNIFQDPDETYYSLNIQDFSALGKTTWNYQDEIGNKMNHIVYVFNGAMCNDKGEVVENGKRHFAIVYRLELSDTAYCIDDN